jgi:hypothetical protein
VVRLGVGGDANFKASQECTPTELDVLDKEEIAIIKAAYLLEYLSACDENASGHVQGSLVGSLHRRHPGMVDRPASLDRAAGRHVENGTNDAWSVRERSQERLQASLAQHDIRI